MKLLDNARGLAHVVRVLLSRSPVSSRVNLKSTFFGAGIGTSLNYVREPIRPL